MKNYLVSSPEMVRYDPEGIDPPEYYRICVEVGGNNRRDARRAAISHRKMNDWVTEARGDNKNPLAGLVVEEWTDAPIVVPDA